MVAVEGDDYISRGAAETSLIGASVAGHSLGDYLRAHRSGDIGCAIGGVVVDHDHLVHEVRHFAQDQLNSFFLIQTRNDYCYRLAFIHADIIVIVMKFLVFSLLAAAAVPAAQLKDVKSVYFYPMPGGFDQHLARWIVQDHLYRVVSDPKLADAVFTDQISTGFLYKLDHINTPPPPANNSGSTSTLTTNAEVPRESTFLSAKGTLFLVDAKSKQVVWSFFERPKNSQAVTLDKAAKKAVLQLEMANGWTVTK